MQDLLISVIIPVYNVKEYLKKCLDSVINQTYNAIEIILVDDGSTDGSSVICDEYLLKDERIKVIHKKNGGLSSARNAGIEIATGEYVCFVDSDDWIERDFIEVLKKDATVDRIICCGYNKVYGDRSIINTLDKRHIFSSNQFIEKTFNFEIEVSKDSSVNPIGNYAWNKMYPIHCFDKVKYPVGKTFEDIYVFVELVKQVKEVVVLEVAKYNYVQRSDSIVNNPRKEVLFDLIESRIKQERDLISDIRLFSTVQKLTVNACLSLYAYFAKGRIKLNNDELSYLRNLVKEREQKIQIKDKRLFIKMTMFIYCEQLMRYIYMFREKHAR